jgi:hypothetical protein
LPTRAGPAIDPNGGSLVFSDDFSSGSGWYVGTSAEGTFRYVPGGYAIGGTGDFYYFSYSPYKTSHSRISISMTASQTDSGPARSGFGVLCGGGYGTSRLQYEFVVFADGSWAIERRNGQPVDSTGPRMIDFGAGAPPANSTPETVQVICDSAGQTGTRLILMVNGELLGDYTDHTSTVPDNAWWGGILAATRPTDVTTVTVTKVEERDLGAGSTATVPPATDSAAIGQLSGITDYVNDNLLFHSIDPNPTSSFGGWLAGIDIVGDAENTQHSATLTSFSLTDLRK